MSPSLVYPAGYLDLRTGGSRIRTRVLVGGLITGIGLWGLIRVGDNNRSWFDELLPPAAGLSVGLWLLVSG